MLSPAETRTKIAALREQALYLRSPGRRSGPSIHEAEGTAVDLDHEAAALSEALYWAEAERIGNGPYGQMAWGRLSSPA